MKIGILTLPLEVNYGGNLQAFALQKVLRNMGHDAITIDRHKRKEYTSFVNHLAGYCKRLFYYYIKGINVSVKWNPFISDQDFLASSSETQKFIDLNIKMTRRIFNEQLQEIDNEYKFEAYVVGSDQVWLDKYCPMSFLSFVKRDGVKKIAYAASCGKKSFFNNRSKINVCRNLASKFAGISVREEGLVNKCKEQLGIDAQWVLDPTLLLDPEEYLEVTHNKVGNEPILFSYILDANSQKDEVVSNIANMLHVPVVNGNRIHNGNSAKAFPSVDDWIRNIHRAEFIVTDSFHGTVFAILFNKPFISIGNKERGLDRFLSLLNMFGLKQRLVTEDCLEEAKTLVNTPIDYSFVNDKLLIERQKSYNFLSKTLNS